MHFNRRSLLIGTAVLPFLATLPIAAQAGTVPVYSDNGIAIDGTDPLSYFQDGAPAKGSKKYLHTWNGVAWRFQNKANRDKFAANPEAYAPQYGGYCAYAVSEGYTASTVPHAWKIVNGKLYLNYSRRIQRKWEKDIPGRIASADQNWPGIIA